jgi:hypothetical protein
MNCTSYAPQVAAYADSGETLAVKRKDNRQLSNCLLVQSHSSLWCFEIAFALETSAKKSPFRENE